MTAEPLKVPDGAAGAGAGAGAEVFAGAGAGADVFAGAGGGAEVVAGAEVAAGADEALADGLVEVEGEGEGVGEPVAVADGAMVDPTALLPTALIDVPLGLALVAAPTMPAAQPAPSITVDTVVTTATAFRFI
ncbi:hypothetical protein [Demequina lutea]|uniref:Uncharacterized protein n=1 Tax=Demequina lutea TaxID=431489 RepID=A0A7Z0CKM7_9MICO|nr:hypothetical protein [Demequina lutea]NYI41880.1 hypothetical protein [Demequina lutea]